MSSILKRKFLLLLVVVRRQQAVRSAMAVVADSGEVAHLLSASGRIAKVVNLGCRLAMAERADAASEADHLKAKIIPPFQFFVGWLKGKHEVLPNSSQANRCGSTMAFRAPYGFCVKRTNRGVSLQSSDAQCNPVTSSDVSLFLVIRQRSLADVLFSTGKTS